MTLPQQYSTFVVDGHLFGVDVMRVQEVIRFQDMTPVPLAPSAVHGLINLRGQIVTAIDLRKQLGLDPRAPGVRPMNVVIRRADGAVSLLVDAIGDVVDADEDAWEAPPHTLPASVRPLIPGAYKLADRLLLALDVERVVEVGGAG